MYRSQRIVIAISIFRRIIDECPIAYQSFDLAMNTHSSSWISCSVIRISGTCLDSHRSRVMRIAVFALSSMPKQVFDINTQMQPIAIAVWRQSKMLVHTSVVFILLIGCVSGAPLSNPSEDEINYELLGKSERTAWLSYLDRCVCRWRIWGRYDLTRWFRSHPWSRCERCCYFRTTPLAQQSRPLWHIFNYG